MQFRTIQPASIVLLLHATALSGRTSSFVFARVSHSSDSLGEEVWESRRGSKPAGTSGSPFQSDAQYTGAQNERGLRLEGVGSNPHPAPRSFHSQICVYARARDASAKAQGKG